MVIYIVVELFLLLAIFVKNNKNITYHFLMICLTMMSAFRSMKVGADLLVYQDIYYEYRFKTVLDILKDPNYSFAIYCKILNTLGMSMRGFLIVTAIVFALLLSYAFVVNGCDKILTLAVFYMLGLYTQSFCIIRQSFACVIFMIAYAYVDESKISLGIPAISMDKLKIRVKKRKISMPVKFYVLIAIAVGFHTAAILMFALPLFLNVYSKEVRYRPQSFFRDGAILLGGGVVAFKFLGVFVLSRLPQKYYVLYADTVNTRNNNVINAGLLLVLYVIFYVCYKRHFSELSNYENWMMGTTVTWSIALVSMSFISPALGRINLFSEALMAINMGKLLRHGCRRRCSKEPIYIVIFFVYHICYLFRDSIGVVPYSMGW